MDHVSGSNVGILFSVYYNYANEKLRVSVP